jgi:hypothetical protein
MRWRLWYVLFGMALCVGVAFGGDDISGQVLEVALSGAGQVRLHDSVGRSAGQGDSLCVRIPESTHWVAVPGGGVRGATPVTHIRIGAAPKGKYIIQFDATGEFVAVQGIGTGPGGSAHINRVKRCRAGSACAWELRWNPGDKQHAPKIEMKRLRSRTKP